MRVMSPVVTLDVDLEAARVRGNSVVLSGFAGLQEVETIVEAGELVQLTKLLLKPSILKLFFRGLRRSREPSGRGMAGDRKR